LTAVANHWQTIAMAPSPHPEEISRFLRLQPRASQIGPAISLAVVGKRPVLKQRFKTRAQAQHAAKQWQAALARGVG
jgi:hypothetical protein